MKPPFAYFGGKIGAAATIAAMLPPHRVYMEPFFGSGAVLFAKRPAVHEIVNDLSDGVVTFFRVLRERPEELEAVCRLTPYARAEHRLAAEPSVDELEVARRFWAQICQSYGSTIRNTTGWSISTKQNTGSPTSMQTRIGRFHNCAARLAHVYIESIDALELIRRRADDATVIYADPPYLKSTRSARTIADYTHDMPSPEEHRELAEVLKATPATVVLSGYPSDLYEELYGDWWQTDLVLPASRWSGKCERIWANRELDAGPVHLRMDFA